MTEVEGRILESLLDLERAVTTMPAAEPKPDLQLLFSRLDELARQLPKSAEPDLRHYLERKSYQKARLLLEGRKADGAWGGCGRR